MLQDQSVQLRTNQRYLKFYCRRLLFKKKPPFHKWKKFYSCWFVFIRGWFLVSKKSDPFSEKGSISQLKNVISKPSRRRWTGFARNLRRHGFNSRKISLCPSKWQPIMLNWTILALESILSCRTKPIPCLLQAAENPRAVCRMIEGFERSVQVRQAY